MKKKVLFLCTHNSLRSQIAEGILRHITAGNTDAYSAGTIVTGVNPLAVRVMAEKGVDISGQYSKSVNDVMGIHFDYVITVCDAAEKRCPVFPGEYKRLHWSIVDPGTLPLAGEEQLEAFRRTRDMLFLLIEKLCDQEGLSGKTDHHVVTE